MDDLEAMAAGLEARGDYRVLRRLTWRHPLADPDGGPTRFGLVLDHKTTGPDAVDEEQVHPNRPFSRPTSSTRGRPPGDADRRLRPFFWPLLPPPRRMPDVVSCLA